MWLPYVRSTEEERSGPRLDQDLATGKASWRIVAKAPSLESCAVGPPITEIVSAAKSLVEALE